MTDLFAQVPIATNPEALINAAIAAKAAEQAATQAFYVSMAILGALIIIGAVMWYMASKFVLLERNTDGMKEQLIAATRKLALIEGNVIGRAEQTAERTNKAANYKAAAKETKESGLAVAGQVTVETTKETTTTMKEQLEKDEPISIVAEIKEIKPESHKGVEIYGRKEDQEVKKGEKT